MRQVTADIRRAFYAGKKKTSNNTVTDGARVWLHGNMIAEHYKTDTLDGIRVSLAGWNTVTTRDRVNGLLDSIAPGRFVQRNHGAYFSDWRCEDGKEVLTAIDPYGVHYFGHDGTVILNHRDD